MSRLVRAVTLVLLAGGMLVLGACGKKGAPVPAGPADKIIYPRSYPAP